MCTCNDANLSHFPTANLSPMSETLPKKIKYSHQVWGSLFNSFISLETLLITNRLKAITAERYTWMQLNITHT